MFVHVGEILRRCMAWIPLLDLLSSLSFAS